MAFTMSGLSILLCLSLLFLVSPTILEPEFWNSSESMGIFLASISILVLGSFPLFRLKRLRIEPQLLVFQNYLFASNVKEVQLKSYDFYKIVQEETENGFFESVWLIKDGKLVDSFSNYQYDNYKELKSALELENKGQLDLSPMKQFRCRFGSKV